MHLCGLRLCDPLRGSRPRGLPTFKIEDEDDDENDYEVLAGAY